MENKEVKKYLVSIAIIANYETINKIIKNIYEDFSLVFYKTLIKTIVDKENIELNYVNREDCYFNEYLQQYIGYFIISSTINTKEPRKILDKLIDDEHSINSFIKNSKNKIKIMVGVKELFFEDDQYNDINEINHTKLIQK